MAHRTLLGWAGRYLGVVTALLFAGCSADPSPSTDQPLCTDTTCEHGTCDDSSGAAVCLCEPGHAGPRCEICDDGYEGDHCERCVDGRVQWPVGSGACVDDPCSPDPCQGPHQAAGSCTQTTETLFSCGCEQGYSGTLCDECAAGFIERIPGSGICTADPCAPAACRTFYIRDDGDDSSSGESDELAWAHSPWQHSCSGACASYAYQRGDRFLFKCDDAWSEHIALSAPDLDDLTFGAYHGDGTAGVSGERPLLAVHENRAFYVTGNDIDGLTIHGFQLAVTGSGNDARCILGRSDGSNDWMIDDIDCDSTADGIIIYFTDTISVSNSTWHCADDPAGFEGESIVERPVHQTANGTITGNIFAVTGSGSDAFQVHSANDTMEVADCEAAGDPWACCTDVGAGTCAGERYYTLTGPNWTLRHNEFIGGSEDGIDINGVGGVVIEYNYTHDNVQCGINLGHGPDDFICRYNWSHNDGHDTESDAGNSGIKVGGAMGNGETQHSNGGEISYNVITGSFQNGIHFGAEVTDILVFNNTIVSQRDGAGAHDADVMTGGIFFRGNFAGSGIELKNNLIYSANTANSWLIRIASAAAYPGVGVELQDNHYHHVGSTQVFDIVAKPGVRTIAHVQSEWPGQETGTESGDPWFGDAGDSSAAAIGSARFYLQSGSPCRDSGSDLGGPHDDCLSRDSALPPAAVTTMDQDDHGAGWEKGAFGYDEN